MDRLNQNGESVDSNNENQANNRPPLPLDAIFEILKNERRRMTLQFLEENENPVSLSDLAEFVAAHENGIQVQELNSTQRKRAYVGLYQCHLPKMDEMGAVDFNRARGLISKGPHVNQLNPYLEEAEPDRSWSKGYLGLAAVNTVLFLASLGLAGTIPSAPLLVTPILLVSFLALATYHYWTESGGSDQPGFSDGNQYVDVGGSVTQE